MSSRIVICYGTPDDAAAFDEYYTTVHIPLAAAVPGLTAFSWGKVEPIGGGEPPYYAVANLNFADAEALATALVSPEMRTAGKDVRNFATGGVTMFTQNEQRVDL